MGAPRLRVSGAEAVMHRPADRSAIHGSSRDADGGAAGRAGMRGRGDRRSPSGVMDWAEEHLGPDRAARYLRKFHPWQLRATRDGGIDRLRLRREPRTFDDARSLVAGLGTARARVTAATGAVCTPDVAHHRVAASPLRSHGFGADSGRDGRKRLRHTERHDPDDQEPHGPRSAARLRGPRDARTDLCGGPGDDEEQEGHQDTQRVSEHEQAARRQLVVPGAVQRAKGSPEGAGPVKRW